MLALPQWEREAWRFQFDVVGPLDWKREDLLIARVNQYQAIGGEPLKNFVLFRDPTDREPEQSEDALLAALGYKDDRDHGKNES